jgi:phage tail-like protein
MKPVEFRRQVFRNSSQWEYGLSYRLRQGSGGGLELFSRPGFGGWASKDDASFGVASLAVDPCGRMLWAHRSNCQLYCFDPVNNLVEPVVALAQCGDKEHVFGRMFIAAGRLWLLDRSANRLIALRTDTFQIVAEIPLASPIDAAFGGGRLFALDARGIHSYDVNGRPLEPPRNEELLHPVALGADPQGRWVYVVDTCAPGFLRFPIGATFPNEIGRFEDAAPGFMPRYMAVDPDGNLFVSDGSAVIHEFAPDGGYVGSTGDATVLAGISAMTFDPAGRLYVGSPAGIAHFDHETGAAGNQGYFYSRTLDNGTTSKEIWHRLDLAAQLDSGGALDVYYASSDNEALVGLVESVFAREVPAGEKAQALEGILADYWKGPQKLRALTSAAPADNTPSGEPREARSHSMLFGTDTKRYLWMKLQLSGLTPRATAAVSEMRAYYPRLSYLRYLPAVYQQDPASRDFLERFLSLFETVFSGLEMTIERIPDVFDPELTPQEFLDWLAQWLDLGIEEDWTPAVKRGLILNAAGLYRKKGTPAGLEQFLQLVTGKTPVISESFQADRPFILGDGAYLGVTTPIRRQPTEDLPRDQRTILGCSSLLGTTQIRPESRIPVNPFRASAYRYTLLLDLSPQEFQTHQRSLSRIAREYSPAHVHYDMRLISGAGLGFGSTVGVNLRVEDPQPLRLGYSVLGRATCVRGVWHGPELGVDTTLAGPAYGSKNASALSYGER